MKSSNSNGRCIWILKCPTMKTSYKATLHGNREMDSKQTDYFWDAEISQEKCSLCKNVAIYCSRCANTVHKKILAGREKNHKQKLYTGVQASFVMAFMNWNMYDSLLHVSQPHLGYPKIEKGRKLHLDSIPPAIQEQHGHFDSWYPDIPCVRKSYLASKV